MSVVKAKIYKEVGYYRLYPACKIDYEAMEAETKKDDPLYLSFKNPRSLARHRFFFAIMREILPYYQSADESVEDINQLRNIVMIKMGKFSVKEIDGREIVMPDSISFDKMGEQAFAGIVSFTKTVFIEGILDTLNDKERDDFINKLEEIQL